MTELLKVTAFADYTLITLLADCSVFWSIDETTWHTMGAHPSGSLLRDDHPDHSYMARSGGRVKTYSRKPAHVPFDGGGEREDQSGRPRFELLVPLGVPFEDQLLTRCARHMALGARKYASRNWESFSDEAALERSKAGAMRHMFQWLTGMDDEDHAAAVVFNVMAAEHVRAKLRTTDTPAGSPPDSGSEEKEK